MRGSQLLLGHVRGSEALASCDAFRKDLTFSFRSFTEPACVGYSREQSRHRPAHTGFRSVVERPGSRESQTVMDAKGPARRGRGGSG